jgi:hypothetical protein
MASSSDQVLILKTVSHISGKAGMDGIKFRSGLYPQDGISHRAAKPNG